MKANKIYISGQITGLPIQRAKDRFATAEMYARNAFGKETVNPFGLFSDEEAKTFTWRQFMLRDLSALLFWCDTIYMIDNWRESKGARAEHAVALGAGMTVIYEGQ